MQEIEQQDSSGLRKEKTRRKFPLRALGVAVVLAATAVTVTVNGPALFSSSDRTVDIGSDKKVMALSVPATLASAVRQSAASDTPTSSKDPETGNSLDIRDIAEPSTPARGLMFSNTAAALQTERVKKVAKFKLAAKLAHLRFAQHLAIARAQRVEAAARLALAQPAPVAPVATVRVPGAKPQPPARSVAARTKPDAEVSQTPAPILAYATPGVPEEESKSGFGGLGKIFNGLKGGLPGRGSGIAVYDISAAIVHMPDGTKLEAHSGIGHRKDNPKYAHVRNLGPTPPNIYDLRMRERRFHGVEAIRMLPRDLAAMKGRDGMLAHSPLLRRSNGSHGCVAFKDYNKFLKAFKAGKVKKIIVVPSMEKLPKYMAKLNRGTDA